MEKLVQREKDIIEATNMYSYDIIKLHNEYSYVYRFTNEDIDSVQNLFCFNDSVKLLSVLASGDHAFNLIYMGIYKIGDVIKLRDDLEDKKCVCCGSDAKHLVVWGIQY